MFNLKSKVLGAAAVLPVVAVGLLGAAGSAEAAGLAGGFNYSNSVGFTTTGPKVTIGVVDNGFIDFADPSVANLSVKRGDFTAFNSARLFDIDYNPLIGAPRLFMDLTSDFFGDTPGSPDGLNTFSLTQFDNAPTWQEFTDGANLSFQFQGLFDKDGNLATLGDQSQGSGYITFAASYSANGVADFTALKNKFASGQGLEASFTGLAVASVPEPTTMLGLGLVAAGMTVARRRKAVKA